MMKASMLTRMKKNLLLPAAALALSTAFISGLSNFLNKFAVAASGDPVIYTAIKNGLVAVAILTIVLSAGRLKAIKGLKPRQWLKLFAVGIIGGGAPFALFFEGLSQTSALNAALIHKTLVIWVALLAVIFLKERLSWPVAFGVAAVFAGNLLVGGFRGFAYSAGELMILAATLLWAAESLIAKIALREIPSTVVAGARMAFGLLVLIPLSVWRGGSLQFLAQTSLSAWAWTFLASALLLAYVLTWYAALKRAPAIYVAALLVPATLVTNILSAIFTTHSVNWQLVVSSGLFVFGSAIVIFSARNLTPPSLISERVAESRVR